MFRITFFGVRGSIPTPGKQTVEYGGNTSCIYVELGDQKIIIDAGSGIKVLGDFIMKTLKPPFDFKLFITHTHWDHIQGLPFFVPIYIPKTKLAVYGPISYADSLENIVGGQMTYNYFPVNFNELQAQFEFKDLTETVLDFDDFKVITKYLNHPVLTLGYRFEFNGKTFVTCYDTEPYFNMFSPDDKDAYDEAEKTVQEMNKKLSNFVKGADLLVFDSQYTKDDFKPGWGHSTVDNAVKIAVENDVKKLVLFHHDPTRSDEQLEKILNYAYNIANNNLENIYLAREGESIDV